MRKLIFALALLNAFSVSAESLVPESTLVQLTEAGGYFPPPPPGGAADCRYKEVRISNYGKVVVSKCEKDATTVGHLTMDELTKLTKLVDSLPATLEKHTLDEPVDQDQMDPSCGHAPAVLIDVYTQDSLEPKSLATYTCSLHTPANARQQARTIARLLMELRNRN